ncbi:MAG: phage terminase small subunit P27 family [Pseudaminobacter sp.]|nr:phage terminase small subunit P27 family [Pseudaminobacter sp.]
MSVRGRKATLKAIDGGLKGVPKAPDHLPTDMISEWNMVAADLHGRKLLVASMLGLVETYVLAIWTQRQAMKAIEEHGVLTKTAHGMLKPNPAGGMLSKAQEAVARLGAELGLTPAARSKAGFQPRGGPRDDGAPTGLDI